ncbi:N-acetylmuramoyl-L-alanine amidase [Anaerobacillus sp. CMMVII]|uniref:peptidoglycan recognition protein family protein n=1 Tax=Anaerobacillus sp. CMMVII TaxID=2755588 RepID=UPI0021B791BA|nr:N-acetylmuramoyl-L-alanine amidase [Anaerobacillus sp. CMMVII]MCT8137688.1 N-acetylmuramoyl-L-alanine amidase [Anaerobacillus sp. CMMVII]
MAKIEDIRDQTPKRSSTRSVSSITQIARHHSATQSGDFWTFWNGRWKDLGWSTGGYHEIILPDGTVQLCYDANVVTNGVGGHNTSIYNICLVGQGSFTDAQESAWRERAQYNLERFNISVDDVLGHNEFSGQSTGCPGTDMDRVRAELAGSGSGGGQSGSERTLRLRSSYMRGDDVEKVQRAVGVTVDGIFGPQTEQGVRSFQQKHSLTVDGIVGPNTWAVINNSSSSPEYSRLLRLQSPYMRGEDVRQVQQRLGVTTDGIYGLITERAVRNFQQEQGITVDGIVGPVTWERLF